LGREHFKQRIAKEKENKLPEQTRGMSHWWPLLFTFLKGKRRFMQIQIFHHPKTIISQKKSSERNQNPSRYHNSITYHLKFQHKSKISSFKFNPHIKIELLFIT
jgi:hypothetical protein